MPWPSPLFKRGFMNTRNKVCLYSEDEIELGQTIKDLLGNQSLMSPLDAHYLLLAVTKLPFSVTFFFDKIYGKWITSNIHPDQWSGYSSYSGPNATVYAESFEKSAAGFIHYYYHLKLKE